jgi:hypothetical protein
MSQQYCTVQPKIIPLSGNKPTGDQKECVTAKWDSQAEYNMVHDYCNNYAKCDCLQDSSKKEQQAVQEKCMFNVARLRQDNYDTYMGRLGGYLAYNYEKPNSHSSCNRAEQAKVVALKAHDYPWCKAGIPSSY